MGSSRSSPVFLKPAAIPLIVKRTVPELMAFDSELLDIAQAAALLQVSEASLRRWTNRGRLPCLRIGGRRERRFRQADLMAFLEPDASALPAGHLCAFSGARARRRNCSKMAWTPVAPASSPPSLACASESSRGWGAGARRCDAT